MKKERSKNERSEKMRGEKKERSKNERSEKMRGAKMRVINERSKNESDK